MGVGAARGLEGAAQRLGEKAFCSWVVAVNQTLAVTAQFQRIWKPYGKTAVGFLSQPIIKCLRQLGRV